MGCALIAVAVGVEGAAVSHPEGMAGDESDFFTFDGDLEQGGRVYPMGQLHPDKHTAAGMAPMGEIGREAVV